MSKTELEKCDCENCKEILTERNTRLILLGIGIGGFSSALAIALVFLLSRLS